MSDSDVKQRLARLRDLHRPQAEQTGDAGKRARPSLRALMGTASSAMEDKLGRPAGGLGAIAQLAKNPEIRHALLQWLQQQDERGPVRSGGGENAWGLEFGVEALPRPEELTTSSTLEEIARYYQQLETRADWLEAALQETLLEMERVSRFKLAAGGAGDAQEPPVPPMDPSI
ncbi:MAG TPA: hypothetical protein PKY50_03695 [Candidatus Competibacter sp.]|nr:hypothetical protein [Candidatus Competibacter sp.]